MKYLYQAGYIFLFAFLGEALAKLIPFPIPAAIWGLLLLFPALCGKLVRAEKIRECSGFLVTGRVTQKLSGKAGEDEKRE